MWLNICGLWSAKKNQNDLSGVFESPVDITIKAGKPVVFFAQYQDPEKRAAKGPKYQLSITAAELQSATNKADDYPI